MYISNGIAVFILVFHLKFIQDMSKAAANATVIPEHNMSLHPYFNFDVQRNVTARVGQTAFLQCKVEQLGDKSVSFIRKRDLHILTAGVLTYTSDERFQVIRTDRSDRWTLQIKFSQARDSGIYECQVNTEPKMSMAFRLNVVEAKAVIPGPTDIYVKQGSEVVLTCIVSQGPHELGQIYWLRGKHMIDTKTSYHLNDVFEYPDRITISTESADVLQSRLTISKARLTDSSNYSCMPTNAEGTSAIVHVINGEHPAAMQRGCANNNINLSILLYILSLSLLIQYLNRILSTFIVLHVISPHRNPNINDDTSEIHLDFVHIHALMHSAKSPALNLR
ncbi:zwei Ig domain protein zig-8-like [Contarinia nasturtii]|uniref:zwei Ig domain protein zig-8-like n=1 Tax=Contarinia nasturtii TaxID=265458 RepID=UPI0012D3FAE2|nr:zwei Ig domain protein zig-8-like [Contarinia nasturtii]XP_031623504.1 zwei Ig domain protein zig-8-like [Contarinia nasturtii]XP_031623505.1 zwei Ig domain protein zig-8-like [Contarinia nasturtii]